MDPLEPLSFLGAEGAAAVGFEADDESEDALPPVPEDEPEDDEPDPDEPDPDGADPDEPDADGADPAAARESVR